MRVFFQIKKLSKDVRKMRFRVESFDGFPLEVLDWNFQWSTSESEVQTSETAVRSNQRRSWKEGIVDAIT